MFPDCFSGILSDYWEALLEAMAAFDFRLPYLATLGRNIKGAAIS
jgi:hypothetical protein